MAKRNAYSLIEIVVSLSVVAILFALVLYAVQSARETSRRSVCANNLRQIGLALHAYESVVGVLPQSNNGRGFSIHSMLLAHIDRKISYDAINFTQIKGEIFPFATNSTVALAKLSIFHCPSDTLGTIRTGTTSYAGNRWRRLWTAWDQE